MIIEDDRSKTMRSDGIVAEATLRSQQELLALQAEEEEEEKAILKAAQEKLKSDQTIASIRALDLAALQSEQKAEDDLKAGLGNDLGLDEEDPEEESMLVDLPFWMDTPRYVIPCYALSSLC